MQFNVRRRPVSNPRSRTPRFLYGPIDYPQRRYAIRRFRRRSIIDRRRYARMRPVRRLPYNVQRHISSFL